MYALLKLFVRSPFTPLQSHMERVATCVHKLPDLFDALEKKEYQKVEEISKKISKLEHKADLAKNDIRNHLPKGLYLPIDRARLLAILTLQDSIADKAEDIAVLAALKELEILPEIKENLYLFLDKNIETFNEANRIIHEIHELVETTFGGAEAEKVQLMVDNVAYKEHEADLIQRKLLKTLLNAEDQMTYTTFHIWQRIIESIGSLSDLSEKLANQIRMTLELK